mmetsp:Transcript_21806/g.30748  ORF Transcript_21806/g.30748 Transcript_21806/m.30748 type:complete len:191 (-) Transcript_21806:265-837(-)
MSRRSPPKPQPPSPATLITVYGLLGCAASFLFGRNPGDLPENIVTEICPSIIVICIFLVLYSLYDVMGCGIAQRLHHDVLDKRYDDIPTRVPEGVYLAQRAQANQVEQMPPFLVSTLCFSVLVNGKVGAVLAMLWSILRTMYASRYRKSIGIPMNKKGLAMYTIPCYFILNTMLMGSAVHAIRWMIMTNM